jgi:hypothetical protein
MIKMDKLTVWLAIPLLLTLQKGTLAINPSAYQRDEVKFWKKSDPIKFPAHHHVPPAPLHPPSPSFSNLCWFTSSYFWLFLRIRSSTFNNESRTTSWSYLL